MKRDQALSLFDTAALEAMTSKGLVRRAGKDLEKGEVKGIIHEDDRQIVVQVLDVKVTIPLETPMKSSCTCPAPGACRHIVAAVLFLQKQELGPPSPVGVSGGVTGFKEKLLNYPVKKLQKWGGKRNLKEAFRLLSHTETIDIELQETNKIVSRFSSQEVTVIAFPGMELDDMLVSGAKVKEKEKIFILASVLAFQKQQGKEIENLEVVSTAPKEKKGTPRSRKAVLETVMQLLEEMVSVGLSHLSLAFSRRLTTLSMSAGGAHLPRLALELRGIADEVQLVLNRDARANEANLLRRMSQTYALATSLWQNHENPPDHLVGRHRTEYEPVKQLELFVVSAYRWHTQSDYHGITLLLWHRDSSQWYSWSDSRPAYHRTGFDPVQVYKGDSPFDTACLFNELFGSHLQFLNPGKNARNRLSISRETKVSILANEIITLPVFGSRCFTNWPRLEEYSRSIMSLGLTGFNPLDEIVVVKPARWGKKGFHPVEQVFYWQIEDEKGEELFLAVPFDPVNRGSIEILEHINARREVSGIVGRIIWRRGLLYIYPLSLLREKKKDKGLVINLTLDLPGAIVPQKILKTIRKKFMTHSPVKSRDCAVDFFNNEEGLFHNLRVQVVQADLQALAESGCGGLPAYCKNTFRNHYLELEKASFQILAKHLYLLSEGKVPAASFLLRGYYLCDLHQQAFTRVPPEGN